MPHDLDPFSAPISKRRPLLGVTILLIEDSHFCSEAVRLMTMRSGARLRRADCVRSAHRHLAMYRPDLVIVDLGLPDGSGLDIIEQVRAQDLAVLAISGTMNDETRSAAMAAGAGGFMPKPIGNMKQFSWQRWRAAARCQALRPAWSMRPQAWINKRWWMIWTASVIC